jgi:arylsulfatase
MEDWVATLMAAVGKPDIRKKPLDGHRANGKRFKVHLDSYNFLPYLMGQQDKGPREEFLYRNDGGRLVGLRYTDWKFVFMEQREHG